MTNLFNMNRWDPSLWKYHSHSFVFWYVPLSGRRRKEITLEDTTPWLFRREELCIWIPSIRCVKTGVYEPLTQRLNPTPLSLTFKALCDSAMIGNSHFNAYTPLFMESTLQLSQTSYIHPLHNTAAHTGFFPLFLIITCRHFHSGVISNSTSS